MTDARLKRGLMAPLMRDGKRDFVTGHGAAYLRSKIIQVLLTEGATPRSSGELPFRTNFGSGLHLLRHERNDHVIEELARVYVKDALKRWLPEVEITSFQAFRQNGTLHLHLQYSTQSMTKPSLVEVRL